LTGLAQIGWPDVTDGESHCMRNVSLARRGVTPYSECTQASNSVVASCIAGRIAARIARIDRACVEAVAGPDFCYCTPTYCGS
jgi:hypothetical protein